MRVERIGEATLYLADCLQVLPTLRDVDAVITDPPYSSGGAFRGDRAADVRDKYVQSDSAAMGLPGFIGDNRDQRGFHFWSALWCSAAREACASGALCAFFSDWRQLPVSTDYMQAGAWIWRGIVPWVKTNPRPQMGRFAAQCEFVIWGSNGPMPVDRGVGCLPGFFQYDTERSRDHVTQKPVDLMLDITQSVLRAASPGALVLDPFMGSGTTGVACARLGRRFIGIEQTVAHFETSCNRIYEAAAQGSIFEPERTAQVQAAMFGAEQA